MGTIHDLIAVQGKQAAVEVGLDRRLVEAASSYLSDEDSAISFAFSGWAQVALPHRRLADDAELWQLKTHRAVLTIAPGFRQGANDEPEYIGVPYGSRARMIMLYLQTEAIRTDSPRVALGKSLREWLSRMGMSVGGKTVKEVRDQAERIARCRLTLEVRHEDEARLENQNIVKRALFRDMDSSADGKRFAEAAQLSDSFFELLKKHPVPLEESAIRVISGHSMALDLYLWLAYRLHALGGPLPISWPGLKVQFGAGFHQPWHFRQQFLVALDMALAVYPDARVVCTQDGLVLHPSRPPVARRPHAVAALPKAVQGLLKL